MLKIVSTIVALATTFSVYADCEISESLKNKACSSDYFTAKNSKQLNEYLQYGKFKDGKLLNLEIGFDVKDKEINIGTTCDLGLKFDVDLRASQNGICLQAKNISIKRESSLVADKKAPINLIANDSIKIRRTNIQTFGDVNISTISFNPFSSEILISRDSQVSAGKLNINTPSSLIINDDSIVKSPSVVLSGGNCEIGNNDDQDNDDNRDRERQCKKFKPKFTYTGTCLNNPIPTTLKISSVVDKSDSLKLTYSIVGTPVDTSIKWKFDDEIESSNSSAVQSFLFPGKHLTEAVVSNSNGYFRKLGSYNNVSPTKFNKGQFAIFQFNGLKYGPSKIMAMMGVKRFNLIRSGQDPQLYLGEIPSDSAGNKLIAIPEFNYKGTFNLVVLPAISNPDAYVGQNVDQLNTLLDSVNSSNQSYLNLKVSLQSLLDELKIKFSSLSASDKQKIAEYLQANIFADLHGVTSFKQIKERPITLFGLLIASAYAQDANAGNINFNLNNFVSILSASTYLKTVGVAIGGIVSYVIAPPALRPFVIAAFFLASVAVLAADNDAQEFANSVHAIKQSSLYLRISNQISAGEASNFSIWGQSVPLDSIAPASPLISKTINVKNSVNTQLEKINSQLATVNSNLALLGFSSQVEPLPLLSFPQTTFPTVLSTKYITNVQLISSEDGQASIQNYSKNGNNLLITFNSLRTQHAKLRVTYVNVDLGINRNIDTDIVITVAPNAVINYTKNNLAVNFDSTGNTDLTGLTYSWSFGDGQASTEKSPNHTYSQAGTYPVLLTVTDAYGAEASSRIDVSVISNNTASVTYCNISTSRGTMYFLVNESEEFYLSRTNDACECHTFQVPRGQYSSIYGYFELDSYPGYIESMDYEESIFGEDNIQYYRGGFGYLALYIFKVPPASLDFYKNSCAAIIYK